MIEHEALTKPALDAAFWSTVQEPGQAAATRALGIRPACHPDDGVDVFYRQRRAATVVP